MPSLAQLPPPDLNPWQMVMAADWVVKSVMAILVAASIATWTILLAKSLELRAARARLRADVALASRAASLEALAAEDTAHLAAARDECGQSASLPADGIRDRLALRLQRIEAATGRRLARGVGVLASIGSFGPFIGLFGTVWGIMNAFIGISRAQTSNLAVVAPGIAEALLATAAGLVAAIPAVLVYNHFSRSLAELRAQLGDMTAAVLVLVSRDLDRKRTPGRPVLLRGAAE